MGRREQQARAKKILYNREKRALLLKAYFKKDPSLEINTENNFARIVEHYMDISGTREADEKNIRLLRDLQTQKDDDPISERYPFDRSRGALFLRS